VAEDYGKILGHLYGYRLPTIREEEFLLYEIGVRKACRRQGIGRALVHMMFDWMDAHQVKVAWVIADNSGAEAFYQNLGFRKVEGTLTQLDIRRT
jgi:ribosomal protein S18 acetylase RimI-like enzyme